MRLSDVYYTTQNLDGVPEPEGHASAPEFYQGEDIILDVYFNIEQKPVTVDEWELTAVVKKNKYAINVLFEAQMNNGIYKNSVPGYYKIIIPAEDTARFLAGTYWLVISGKEKNGDGIKDREFVLSNSPFIIKDSAASPYPAQTLNRAGTERTYPPAIDISRI